MRAVGVMLLLIGVGLIAALVFLEGGDIESPRPIAVDAVPTEALSTPTIPDPVRIAPEEPSAVPGTHALIRYAYLNPSGVDAAITPAVECAESTISQSFDPMEVDAGSIVEGEVALLVPHFTAPVRYSCRFSVRDEFGTSHEVAFLLDVV